jgi:ornithine cyclodeaminase
MHVLDDRDVRRISPQVAVAAMRNGLLEASAGQLTSPPRLRAELGPDSYVFTVGGLRGGHSGFRAYRTGANAGDQLVAVWGPDGRLAGVVVGDELGARRTGALGGVAADVLARPDATIVAVIGTGRQAWTQLWAISAVRALSRMHVYSRDPEHRAAFARRAAEELQIASTPAPTAELAAGDADIVVLATTATQPVIDAAAIRPGTHLTTVGPKLAGAHEAPTEILAKAAIVACDSPQQAAAYTQPFFVEPGSLTPLSAVLDGSQAGRIRPEDITIYCSVGLAGTEVLLAAACFT